MLIKGTYPYYRHNYRCIYKISLIKYEYWINDHVIRDKLSKLIESLNTQLVDKGAEINGYMEKHNIQVKGQGGNENKKVSTIFLST